MSAISLYRSCGVNWPSSKDPKYLEQPGRRDLPYISNPKSWSRKNREEGSPHRWVLSYDAEPLILDLYRGRSDVHHYRVTHHYTMTGRRKKPVPGREVIFTNLPVEPTAGTDGRS